MEKARTVPVDVQSDTSEWEEEMLKRGATLAGHLYHLPPSSSYRTLTEVMQGEEGVDSVTFKLYYEKPVI